MNEDLMVQQIHLIRKHQPMCGGRKLFMMLQPFFAAQNIQIGRDAFFDVLAKNKLLIRPHKRRVSTTNSRHHFRRFPNLAKDFMPMKAHELWVSDITYIPLKERFAYLFLITDAYSRKIVGFHVSDDMKVSSAVVALKKALLQQHHALISMTQSGDPLENAIAERVNGILKTELISSFYNNIDEAALHISRCIIIYNYKRRHSSLNWQIPAEVHQQKGPQIKRWKNYYKTPEIKAVMVQEA